MTQVQSLEENARRNHHNRSLREDPSFFSLIQAWPEEKTGEEKGSISLFSTVLQEVWFKQLYFIIVKCLQSQQMCQRRQCATTSIRLPYRGTKFQHLSPQ